MVRLCTLVDDLMRLKITVVLAAKVVHIQRLSNPAQAVCVLWQLGSVHTGEAREVIGNAMHSIETMQSVDHGHVRIGMEFAILEQTRVGGQMRVLRPQHRHSDTRRAHIPHSQHIVAQVLHVVFFHIPKGHGRFH